MSFLKKIQEKPRLIKEAILWSTMILVAAGLFIAWTANIKKQVDTVRNENFADKIKIPGLEEEMNKFKQDIQISEEDQRAWAELDKQMQQDILQNTTGPNEGINPF